jgi:hypothetical protein
MFSLAVYRLSLFFSVVHSTSIRDSELLTCPEAFLNNYDFHSSEIKKAFSLTPSFYEIQVDPYSEGARSLLQDLNNHIRPVLPKLLLPACGTVLHSSLVPMPHRCQHLITSMIWQWRYSLLTLFQRT